MNFRVIVKPTCKRRLDKLSPEMAVRIKERLKEVQKKVNAMEAPVEHFMKYIKKYGVWSLRVGYYRVFCDLDRRENILYALTVLPRDRAYKRLGG